MSNFWQDEDEGEFRDTPDEVQLDASGRPMEAPPAQVRSGQPTAAQQQQLKGTLNPKAPVSAPAPVAQQPLETYEQEEPSEQEDEDFSSVLNDARIRLEQGRLYEMIMNNDLFEGTEADPKAVKHVQKQIRNFAKEQMEIMLGMRPEPSQQQALLAENFPFNALEVEALKALASAATKGATQTPEAEAQSGAAPATAARQGLKPISLRPAQRAAPAAPKAQTKPLQSKPATPVVRKKNDMAIEQILAEEGVTREELEKTFDPNYKPLGKHPSQLTEQEIIERNKRMTAQKPVKSANALPMPTPEQEEMMYSQRANQAIANNPSFQTIMSLITKK